MPNEIREIITKAVIGKGNLKNKTTYPISAIANVSSILGCWIVNHQYQAEMKQGKLYVNGQFDLNIWYSLEEDKVSKVHVETVNYHETLNVVTKEKVNLEDPLTLLVSCPQEPVCLEAKVNALHQIEVTIEKALHVDVVGETKICVEISSEPEIWDEIDMEIDPTFLEK